MFFKKKNKLQKRHANTEVILDNKVDKDVKRFLLPLNIIQKIFFGSEYKICDNLIFPNDWKKTTLSLIGNCIIIILFFIRLFQSNPRRTPKSFKDRKYNKIFDICRFSNFTLYSISFIVNVVANSFRSSINVRFVLRIQKLIKTLNFNKQELRQLMIWNRIYCVITFIQYIIFIVMVYNLYHYKLETIDIVSDFTLILFDANMLYAIRMAVLINNIFLKWQSALLQSKDLNVNSNEVYWKEMFEIYVEILKCYDLFSKLLQDKLLCFIAGTFGHSLIYVEVWIAFVQTTEDTADYMKFSIISMVLVLIWMVKHIVLIVLLVVQMEKFYITVESVLMSAKTMDYYLCSEAERRMYKNIIRIQWHSFVKANVRGLFNLDATLPLAIATQITTYTIVLLQSALK